MEQFMTSEEVAERLHVDPVTIRRLVNRGDLSAYRIGADYRFAPSDLQNYLQRQRVSSRVEDESGTNSNYPFDQLTQLIRKVLKGKHTTPSGLLDRFERFTKRACHVMLLAEEEARHYQHNYIGTEHLLLGLVRERESVAAQVLSNLLSNLGIDVNQVRLDVEAIIGRGDQIVLGEVELTSRARRVIELAVEEARRLNHQHIGTEHILLGLIREDEGVAANVLEGLGILLGQARIETIQVLHQRQQEEASAVPLVPLEAAALLTEEERGLTCSHCNARCPDYFRYCFNCGQPFIHEELSHSEEE